MSSGGSGLYGVGDSSGGAGLLGGGVDSGHAGNGPGRHNRPGGRRRGVGDGSRGNGHGHYGYPPAHLNAHGLVARLKRIKHVTPKHILERPLYLPAMLNDLAVTQAALHTDYDTLSAGQFSQPAMGRDDVETQLTTLSIDTVTLTYDANWLVVTRQSHQYIRDTLVEIVRSREPVHLMIHWHPHRGGPPEVELKVTLRSLTRTVHPGENDTYYWTFDVHQWRDPTIPVHSSRPHGGHGSRKRTIDGFPTTHKLTDDDTLHSLAHEYYGTYRFWRDIRDANGISRRWGAKDPLVKLRRFKVGSKIIIPPPERQVKFRGWTGPGVFT